jgi:anaerobic magnesium-protoporphyrin IX monomethyl ester cyclase
MIWAFVLGRARSSGSEFEMKILLVSTNRERSPQTIVPLGVCCVASAAEAAGHEITLLDLCFERDPTRAMTAAARSLGPDVVGFSIRNFDNCDYTSPRSYLPEIAEVVGACREACGAKIVLGGSAVSQAPEALLRTLGGDVAVVGEGEEAFPALLRALESGSDVAAVPGVVVGECSSPSRCLPEASLAAVPDPNPSRWLDLRRYRAHDAALPVQTKRGCMFDCAYCAYPLLEGREWRLREPEWVAEQVAEAPKAGLRSVDFVDSVFGLPRDHAIACCEAIARRTQGRLPLSTMDLNPLGCSSDLVQAMNAAGFSAVGISAESGSDAMLASLRKGFASDDLRRAAANVRALDAARLWVFMLGGPAETEATVRETARFIGELSHSDLVMVTHGLRVLPGTALRARLVDEGTLEPDVDLSQPVFYHSPHVTPERSAAILRECGFPPCNVVTLTDGGHRLAPMVQRVASMLGVRPPFWRYLPAINRARRLLRV